MPSFLVLSYSAVDLIALFVVVLGILVQARVGMGFALLSAPILFLLNENYMPGPILILGFSLSLLIFCFERQSLASKMILPAIIARLPGAWVGVLVLAYLPQPILGLMIGFSLLLACLLTSLSASLSLNKVNLSVAGFLSGLSGTVTSIGGPIIALVFQHQPPQVTRKAMNSFFLIGTPMSILLLMVSGQMSHEAFSLSLKMLPGVLLGYFLSKKHVFTFIAPSKKGVMLLCVLSALIILIKSSLLLA